MEPLILLLLIVVLIVLLTTRSSVLSELRSLDWRVMDQARQIDQLRDELKRHDRTTPRATSDPPARETDDVSIASSVRQPSPQPDPITPAMPETPTPSPSPAPQPERVPADLQPTAGGIPWSGDPATSVPPATKPGFFEKHPDLEKFIGENLANKVGIAILVVGIGFFVKFAIDQNWINEIGRVFIGILCGGLLVAIAHRLRKTFVAFSSVLVGGGIAVLYFTIAIAFHEYQIFPQAIAFVLMVVITAFTVVLSLGYNRVELAVFAILGGFGSPFMVSTGEGNYVVLFTYMLILNGGMLALAYQKKWRIINFICYFFTIVIFGSWLGTRFEDNNTGMLWGGLLFATLFYLTFFAMNIVNNLRRSIPFQAPEIAVLLSNTFFYFSAGIYILNNDLGADYRGLFTSTLAVFNFIFAYVLYKHVNADRNLVFMLIGLVLTFVSLAAPIQLEGNYITLFWAAEAVLLLWLSQKSGIKLMATGSVIVTTLMIISLIMDWNNLYIRNAGDLAIMLNKAYVTGVVVLLSLTGTTLLLRREPVESRLGGPLYKTAILVALVATLYFANLFELRHQLIHYVESIAAQTVIIGTYNMGFIAMLLLLTRKLALPEELRQTLPLLAFVAIGSYLFYYHSYIIDARTEYLESLSPFVGFGFHYLLVAFLILAATVSLKLFNRDATFLSIVHNTHWWLYIFLFVFLASAELDHIVLLALFTDAPSASGIIEQNHRIGYPILWGVASFLLIAVGLSRKIKTLRIISLVLLLITLCKLFIVDLRDISEGGKIAAFISLGVLLLIVSFMYQRLKKLLLDDAASDEH